MTNSKSLESDQVVQLRERNLLSRSEIAYVAGDLIVAENITTGEKRVVGEVTAILSESNKRVLKG